MDINLKRRARERAIASEIAHELHRALGPAMPEALAENRDVVCETFARVFDRHGIVNEACGGRILSYIPGTLANLNRKYADLNRQLDAAVRQPRIIGTRNDYQF